MVLSAAVSAGFAQIDKSYEAKKLGEMLDWLNLMTYDLHGDWDTITGHHTAMGFDGGTCFYIDIVEVYVSFSEHYLCKALQASIWPGIK